MTNQTIPPCPVCGTVPKLDSYKRVILTGECRLHILNNGVWCKKKLVLDVGGWAWYCNQAIGRACRELGIETVEQLKTRLAPDPRVAVLDDVLLFTENAIRYAHLAYCRTLEREPEYLAEMKRIIAAQRGEG